MEFVRQYLLSLVSGALALVFVAVAVVGMMSDSVREKMGERVSAAGEIDTFAASPVNEERISAERRRVELFKKEFAAALDTLKEINARKELMPGVFPEPTSGATLLEFQNAYRGAIGALPGVLLAEGLPTESDYREAYEDIEEQRRLEQEMKSEGEPTDKEPVAAAANPRFEGATGEGGGMMMGRGFGGRGAPMGRGFGGGGESHGNLPAPDKSNPKYDYELRARVMKAKTIRMYADIVNSFHISPIGEPQAGRPTVDALWKAQVGLWIQEDVVSAIAELNADAARQLRDVEPQVENMPVKRLERINVLGYRLKDRMLEFEAWSPAESGRDDKHAGDSFTNKVSDDQFDVLRFNVIVVVDQRELMRLVDSIVKKNLYKCIELDYAPPAETDAERGYLYGSAPCVRARLEFEAYMSRKEYATMMPKAIAEQLGVKKEEGGGG